MIAKTKKILLFLFACAFILINISISGIKPQAAGASESDLQKQISDKKASLTSSANKRKELENKIASLKTDKTGAENEKRHYDALIETWESEITLREELIEDYGLLLIQEETEIEQAQSDYEKSYAVFLKMIKFAYEEGNVNYLNLLLDSENFTNFLSRIDIISNIVEYNKNAIVDLQETKKNWEEKKSNHQEMIDQLDEYINELSEKSDEVEGWRKKAEANIEQLKNDLDASIAMEAQMKIDDANIQAEINRASKELQALQESKRVYVGGTLLWPVTPKYSYAVSSGFGGRYSPITGRWEHHNGIDIPAAYGAPIWSVNDGIVIIATYSAGYGNYIVIDHGGGKTTLYAHASSLTKKVGDKVAKGDVVAKVGSTGWSTGNHLHFGYAEDGVFKDPLKSGLVKP